MPHKNKSLPKPPPKKKKKAKRLEIEARATSRGMELGKADAHKKKSIIDSMKDHVGHMIDQCSLLDVAAVAAGTLVIHGIIINTPELQSKALTLVPIGVLGLAGVPYTMVWQQLFPGQAEPLKDEWPYWIAAFFVAFVVVRNGGQLLGLLDKGIGQIVGLMLA